MQRKKKIKLHELFNNEAYHVRRKKIWTEYTPDWQFPADFPLHRLPTMYSLDFETFRLLFEIRNKSTNLFERIVWLKPAIEKCECNNIDVKNHNLTDILADISKQVVVCWGCIWTVTERKLAAYSHIKCHLKETRFSVKRIFEKQIKGNSMDLK